MYDYRERGVMPPAPNRVCRKPGCNKLTNDRTGYCVDHQDIPSIKQAEYDKRRGSSNARGYDYKWQKLRKRKLRANPFCEMCGRVARLVHHIDEIPKNNEWSNLMSVCKLCHEKLHPDRFHQWVKK